MQKTKMNEMNVLVNPLTHFSLKIKAFPLSFLNGKRMGHMKRNMGWAKDIKDRNEMIPRVGRIIA